MPVPSGGRSSSRDREADVTPLLGEAQVSPTSDVSEEAPLGRNRAQEFKTLNADRDTLYSRLPVEDRPQTGSPADPILLQNDVVKWDGKKALGATATDPLITKRPVQPKYVPVPSDPVILERKAAQVLQQITSKGVAPHNSALIMDNLRMLVDVPQASHLADSEEMRNLGNMAVEYLNTGGLSHLGFEDDGTPLRTNQGQIDSAKWILEHPEFIAEWQNSYWQYAMAAPALALEGQQVVGNDRDWVTKVTADFFKKWEGTLLPEHKEQIINSGLMSPDYAQIVRDADVRANEGFSDMTGWQQPLMKGLDEFIKGYGKVAEWLTGAEGLDETYNVSSFRTGRQAIFRAPEAGRGLIQNPYFTLLAELDKWLEAGGNYDNVEDYLKFSELINQRTFMAVNQVESSESGFGAVSEALFLAGGEPQAGNAINDWIFKGGDPDSYFSAAQSTFGQNMAYLVGEDPSSERWEDMSGGFDAMLTLSPAMPINFIAGIGNGISAAARVPRAVSVSKLDILKKAAGGSRLPDVPVFSQGPVSRFAYAAFSKDMDTWLKGRGMSRFAQQVADETSSGAIARMAPSWAKSKNVLEALTIARDPEIVKEIVRAAVINPDLFGETTPMYRAYLAEEQKARGMRHQTVLQRQLDRGVPLRDLGGDAQVHAVLQAPSVVERPPPLTVVGDAVNEGAAEAAVRNGRRLAKSDVVLERGDIVVRRSGDAFAAFDKNTGETLGGLNIVRKEIGTSQTFRSKGAGSAMADAAEEAGYDVIGELSQGPMSQDFVDWANKRLKRQADAAADLSPVMKVTELAEDGSRKAVIHSINGAPSVRKIDIDRFANYLDNAGLTDDAIRILDGVPLSQLSPQGQEAAQAYTRTTGAVIGQIGDEVVITSRGRKYLMYGDDAASTARSGPAYDAMRESATSYMTARNAYQAYHANVSGDVWFIADVAQPLNQWTRSLRNSMSIQSESAWAQNLRRTGFRLANSNPQNIPLDDAVAGARGLRSWLKLAGASDELADEWFDAFMSGNIGNRWEIVREAFADVGKTIENPFLREGWMQFNEKASHSLFFIGESGDSLGLLRNSGRVRPPTVSHLASSFPMPNAKDFSRSLRRYRGAKRMPKFLKRGVPDAALATVDDSLGARALSRIRNPKGVRTRGEIARQLEAKAKASGVTGLMPEDYMNMAYADILGARYGRSAGFGALARTGRVAGKAYDAVHNTFVLAQLAGRPISWTTRVLLEEQIRAGLFGLPALWKNPNEYAYQMFSADGIRALPDLLVKQGKYADTLVREAFDGGFDIAKIRRIIPEIESLAEEFGVRVGDTDRFRAFVSQIVTDELFGITDASVGSRLNISSNMVKQRTKKVSRITKRMARDGMDASFTWKKDGAAIAQRSMYKAFLPEAEAATMPSEWVLGKMSARQQETHGRMVGRQLNQMIYDPIVGTYGFRRALNEATGNFAANQDMTRRLVETSAWGKIRHVVVEMMDDAGIGQADELTRAQWYMDNVVDEIVDTLINPLSKNNTEQRVTLLSSILESKSMRLNYNGKVYDIAFDADNYEGAVSAMGKAAQGAYEEGAPMPRKVAAYFEPRLGQYSTDKTIGQKARELADWTMQFFAERPTQALHRQPAFKHIHGKYYRYFKDMGWSDDAARAGANQKAAEMTNYVFFDNNNIPGFLKDMNRYIPFFSAFFEVTSTWMYKIPSVNVLPVGFAHMGARVGRTLNALEMSGLASYDPELNQYTLTLDKNMQNVKSEALSGVSKSFLKMMRAPALAMRALQTGASAFMGETGWPGIEDWAKDGYQFAVGNPLDPTSSGLMAVNQFSIGQSPAIAWPIGIAAEAFFSTNDEKIVSPEGTTVEEFLAANPNMTMEQVLRYNEAEFLSVNAPEMYRRAIDGDANMDDLIVPTEIKIPNSSFIETLSDNVFFPFGKLHQTKGALNAISPSYGAYLFRGLFQRFGLDDDTFIEWMLGSQSNVAMASEVMTQLQMREAATGDVERIRKMNAMAMQMLEEAGLSLSEDNSREILNPEDNESVVNRVQEVWRQVDKLTEDVLREANNAAGGSMFLRGITGALGPVTPRMYLYEQDQIAEYWAARDMAERWRETKTLDFKGSGVKSLDDLARLTGVLKGFMDDTSGDQSKLFMLENYPALKMYMQGKSYWGGTGVPVYAKGFDQWMEQQESGERVPFPPEVFMMRYWRSGISMDREVAIIEEYGNDPVLAAQAILNDGERYRNATEDFDYAYDSIDLIDAYLFEGKYASWSRGTLDDLSVYEFLEEEERNMREQQENNEELLRYTDLSPEQRREIQGVNSTISARRRENLEQQRLLAEQDETWLNPREKLLNDYYTEVSGPYYEELQAEYDELNNAKTSVEVSRVWERVRDINDDAFKKRHYLLDEATNRTFEVPAPMVKWWNNKPQQERQERMLSMIAKKPQWLSEFEVAILASETPAAYEFFPVSGQSREMYKEATRMKDEIWEAWRADPGSTTPSERNRQMEVWDEDLDEWLLQNGRGREVEFRNATPTQKLDMLGFMPASWQEAMPVYNSVLAELESIGKSPRTNTGETNMRRFEQWLESDYYPKNPTAEQDFLNLSWAMYGTKVPSVAYARMLRGEQYGR